MGCTGEDEYAEIMKQKAKEVGLNTVYQVNNKTPTGKCAVLITGSERYKPKHKYRLEITLFYLFKF
jgi:adenosine kinase